MDNTNLEEFEKYARGKKVAIIGIGVSNLPLLEYFYDLNARVTIFDSKESNQISVEAMQKIEKYGFEFIGGKDSLSRLKGFDIIFRSPSCMPDRPELVEAVENGAVLTSEIEMVLKLAPCKVIGVTGTEGKTTTTTLINEIVKKYNKENSVRILEYTNKVPELMSISDLVVSKPGGLTTSESLASNLPMIIINPIPGQEEENAEFLEEKGVGIWIKKNDLPDKIFGDLLSNSEKLQKMKENTNILAKKHSTENICKFCFLNN